MTTFNDKSNRNLKCKISYKCSCFCCYRWERTDKKWSASDYHQILRGTFEIVTDICNKPFLRKYLVGFIPLLFLQKKLHHRFIPMSWIHLWYLKNPRWLTPSLFDRADFRILKSEWPTSFCLITQKPEISQIWNLCWHKVNNLNFYLTQNSGQK